MNIAALNIPVQVSGWTYISFLLGICLMGGIAGSYGNSVFSILRICQTVPKATVPFYFPTTKV